MSISQLQQISVAFLLLSSVFSCSLTALPSNVQNSVGQTESGIASATRQLSNTKSVQHNNFVLHTANGYFGNQVILETNNDFLPPIFSNTIQIDKQFNGMRSIATALTDLTRIPTSLDMAIPEGDGCNDIRITQQDGNLIDLLNLIGSHCDIAWTYREGKLMLSDTETKTWMVKNIPGEIEVQNQINNNTGIQSQSGANGNSVGSGSGGAGSTGQSQAQSQQSTVQNIAFNLSNSLWTNLQDGIKNIISKSGRFNVSPSTSSLTVTDKPSVLSRVDKYMQYQNEIMSRQVQIDVQILNVDVTATDNYGINWNLALHGTNASFSINGQATTQGASNSTATLVPVFVPTNTTQAFTIGANSGDLSGSQLVINALSTVAKTALITSTAVTTLSNQPVPVQFVDQQSYLASVTNTQTANVGSQVALTPGQLTTGFSLNVLPVVQGDGTVYMQVSINLSSLKQISQFSTEGASVQLPETLQRNLMQKAVVRSGDCFVVTGFDSDTQAITNNGVGSAYNWLFGGGVSASKIRTRMVILVTPRVVNV